MTSAKLIMGIAAKKISLSTTAAQTGKTAQSVITFQCFQPGLLGVKMTVPCQEGAEYLLHNYYRYPIVLTD